MDKLRSLLLLFSFFSPPAFAEEFAWFKAWSNSAQLAAVLGPVPEGKSLLARAEKRDAQILAHVSAGPASLTEKTVASFDVPFDGQDKVERQSGKISIHEKLGLADAAADLAHELTHFLERSPIDPYQEDFSEARYVREGIEGKGGELEAFARECEVARALEKKFPAFPAHRLCAPFWVGGVFQKEKARLAYYALGSWWPKAGAVKKNIPELSAASSPLASNRNRKPYPISLAEEFRQTWRNACVANREYRNAMLASAKARKIPDSTVLALAEFRKVERFAKEHCSGTAPGK